MENRIGGWLTVAGAAGVVVITGIYGASPHLASVPLPLGADMNEVMRDTLRAAGNLRLAGNIGLIADLLLIAGVSLLIRRADTVWRQVFWSLILLSTFMFVFVDGIAAYVVVPVAQSGSAETLIAVRGLFDICFSFGVLTFGAAFLCLGMVEKGAMRIASLVVALAGIAGYALFVAGLTQPLLLGFNVGLAGILLILIGLRHTDVT